MEIKAMEKNCMGTMDLVLKIGKMKKAEEFTAYPIQKEDDGAILYLQSEHRWAELNTRTGEVEVSARRAQYAIKAWFLLCQIQKKTEHDQATPEQLAQILSAVRGTASEHAGNNVLSVFCDNSGAALV